MSETISLSVPDGWSARFVTAAVASYPKTLVFDKTESSPFVVNYYLGDGVTPSMTEAAWAKWCLKWHAYQLVKSYEESLVVAAAVASVIIPIE